MNGAAIDAIVIRVAVAVVPQSAPVSAAGVTVAHVIASDVTSSSVIRKIHEIVHMSGKENEIAIRNVIVIGIGIVIVQGAAIISVVAVAVAPRHRHVVMQHAITSSNSSSSTSIRVNMAAAAAMAPAAAAAKAMADQTWWT